MELPKFKKEIGELTTLLDCWLYFVRHGEDLDADAHDWPTGATSKRNSLRRP